MFVIVFKQHGTLNIETRYFGPYTDYTAAEDALCDGTVPLLYGQGGREWPANKPDEYSATMCGDSGYRFIAKLEQSQ